MKTLAQNIRRVDRVSSFLENIRDNDIYPEIEKIASAMKISKPGNITGFSIEWKDILYVHLEDWRGGYRDTDTYEIPMAIIEAEGDERARLIQEYRASKDAKYAAEQLKISQERVARLERELEAARASIK
jgi:hypothetical protein